MFLSKNLDIDDKKANQLIKLVGGRIGYLEDYGKQLQGDQQFEGKCLLFTELLEYCIVLILIYSFYYFSYSPKSIFIY